VTWPCPFDPELAVYFVHGLPSGHVPLLEAGAGGPAALWDEAIGQLRQLTLERPAEMAGEGGARVVRYAVGDGLDAARLLLPDLPEALAAWLSGRPLAAVPCRDLLLLVGDADEELLAGLRDEVAARYARDPYPLSPRWFRLEGSGSAATWRPLEALAAD
jgi:hypothetical protein